MSTPLRIYWEDPVRSETAEAAYYALIKPFLFGRKIDRDKEFKSVYMGIRAKWHVLVDALYDAGWDTVCKGDKLVFVRNCPPCGVLTEPRLQRCKVRGCPPCTARKVAEAYEKVKALVDEVGDCTVVSWHLFGYSPEETSHPVLLSPDGTLHENFDQAYRDEKKKRARFPRRYMRGAYGGASCLRLAPSARGKLRDDGAAGWWSLMRGCIAVGPPDWQPSMNTPRHPPWVIRNPDPYTLANMVGQALSYNPHWLDADPVILVELLRALKNDRAISYFGQLSNRWQSEKNSTNSA